MLNAISRFFLMIAVVFTVTSGKAFAQSGSTEITSTYITTAVPFLLIPADARTSAMGGTGVALLPQNTLSGLNGSSLAFIESKSGFAISYAPWLSKLARNRKLMYADGFLKLNEDNVIGTSLKYLSYGQFELSSAEQQNNGVLNPNEFVFSLNYAKKFSPDFSLGISTGYISSNLYTANGNYAQLYNGNGVAVGVSGFYRTSANLFNKSAIIGLGFSLENIGPKMNYENDSESSFYLPTNLRLGTSFAFEGKNEDQLTFALDLSKLLVPSNSTADFSAGPMANKSSVLSGIINSFTDASNGFAEELQELQFAIGFEYSLKNKIAFRSGYSYQNSEKGNNSFFSAGLGVKHKSLGFDIGYLIGNSAINSFSNTLRLTLSYNFKGI